MLILYIRTSWLPYKSISIYSYHATDPHLHDLATSCARMYIYRRLCTQHVYLYTWIELKSKQNTRCVYLYIKRVHSLFRGTIFYESQNRSPPSNPQEKFENITEETRSQARNIKVKEANLEEVRSRTKQVVVTTRSQYFWLVGVIKSCLSEYK